MKSTTVFLFYIVSSFSLFSQSPRALTETEIAEINSTVNKEAENLRAQLVKDDSTFYVNKELMLEFQLDTFRIEQNCKKRLEIDYSTAGMVNVAAYATSEYDKLLNNYYQQLLSRLEGSDKEILKAAQRNWVKFRDSELNLIHTLAKEEYSGGGTIQSVLVSAEILELTRQRTIDVYFYLAGIYKVN